MCQAKKLFDEEATGDIIRRFWMPEAGMTLIRKHAPANRHPQYNSCNSFYQSSITAHDNNSFIAPFVDLSCLEKTPRPPFARARISRRHAQQYKSFVATRVPQAASDRDFTLFHGNQRRIPSSPPLSYISFTRPHTPFTMAGIAADSPLGLALQERIMPKIMELGWGSGEQDDTLSEYIVLMLANGNNEQEIARELSTDLLSAEPDDPAPGNFAKWLFEQINELQQQMNGGQSASAPPPSNGEGDAQATAATGDEAMGESEDGSGVMYVFSRRAVSPQQKLTLLHSPTGPKAMRNGTKGATRDKRMIGNINKNLDRSTDVLHRVRGTAGTGRINSHSRDPPKGPRQTNIQRNLAGAGAGRGMMQNMPMAGPMGQMPFGAQQNGGQMVMDGNQMQQMLHMLERQAQMMAQMSNNMPGSFNNQGRTFNDRVEKRGRFQNRRQDNQNRQAGDTEMGEDGQPIKNENGEGENDGKPAEETMCRFNKMCKNPDCRFAHSGPVTFTGLVVDTTSECQHGAACMNNRCTSRHPSPAKKQAYQSTVPCKFGPFCQKPGCTFQHPPHGPCKNGADCTEEGCQFWHNPVMCKYPQCTNKNCPYKHEPGQKRGYYRSNQVVFNGEQPEHVSERQFVAGEGEEELITPGAGVKDEGAAEMDVVS